jgi:hypothetical protein
MKMTNMTKKDYSSILLSHFLSIAAECEYYHYINNWVRTNNCYQYMYDEIEKQKQKQKQQQQQWTKNVITR